MGYVPACVLLGHLYLDGVGVEKDRRKALELLMLGKRHGVYGANYFLGEYYMQEGELHLALKHFEAAVADGDDSAREQVDMLRAMLS